MNKLKNYLKYLFNRKAYVRDLERFNMGGDKMLHGVDCSICGGDQDVWMDDSGIPLCFSCMYESQHPTAFPTTYKKYRKAIKQHLSQTKEER